MDSYIQIETDHLSLRTIALSDSEQVFKYRSDFKINQYQNWIPKTMSEVRDFIENKVSFEIDQPDTWHQLVIIKKDSNELIGDIGIHFLDWDNYQVELGCTIDKQSHGKGYATEALRGTINYLFDKLNKRRIIASVDPRNQKSIQLMERLGFRKEAHHKESILINNEWIDDLIYAILAHEWMSPIE